MSLTEGMRYGDVASLAASSVLRLQLYGHGLDPRGAPRRQLLGEGLGRGLRWRPRRGKVIKEKEYDRMKYFDP